ncbi:MAG: endonuclease/exonuclease/phosphatase family protein [Candidatus Nomurabacteria bacterium]|jgi:endonuclease/exonuclease/phosphatase family metal-dependent hydrolase|nr:endonuclease/exonuclease/phosphatase family protein [Candidatus Nomurabacteria bacterium]
MKIISLNIAGRSNFGRNYQKRIADIAGFLSQEDADVVCLQEVTFDDKSNLADGINLMLKKPYPYVYANMSEKYTFDKFSAATAEKWEKGLIEHIDDYLTDGMGVLSKSVARRYEGLVLKPAPKDERGRPDFHVRLVQNIELASGLKISNVHLATNHNSYQQLDELLRHTDSQIIIGDFNITREQLLEHQDIWANKYQESTDFQDYVSFPEDGVAYDHLLLSKEYRFVSIRLVEGLSDHCAVVFEVEGG